MTSRLTTIVFLTSLIGGCCNSAVTDTNQGGGSAGGSGGATSSSSSSSDTGGTTATPTDTTTAGLCADDFAAPPSGGNYPSECACADEAEATLPLIAVLAANQAALLGKPCLQAVPIPATPPKGQGYKPGKGPGVDFGSGDDTIGWTCLGYAPLLGIHCQYGYQAGKDYVGPTVGGPDPGATGFEVFARGDSDGDGVESVFSIAGTLDPQTGEYTLSPIFEHLRDE